MIAALRCSQAYSRAIANRRNGEAVMEIECLRC